MYIQLLIYTIYVHTVQKNAFYLFASARRRKGCVMCIIQVQLKIRPICGSTKSCSQMSHHDCSSFVISQIFLIQSACVSPPPPLPAGIGDKTEKRKTESLSITYDAALLSALWILNFKREQLFY